MISAQEFFKKSYEHLVSLAKNDGLTKEQIEAFVTTPDQMGSYSSLNDVFKLFTVIAQDYQYMPNVINASGRKDILEDVLSSYDYKKVLSTYTEDSLFEAFSKRVIIKNAGSPKNSWRKYVRSILSFCSFISEFDSFEEFNAFIAGFSMNNYSRAALPMLLEKEIFGFGFALACNLLKELGYMDYPKPDTHTIDVMAAAGFFAKGKNANENQLQCYKAMLNVAKAACVSPYTLDKVIWLICSGDYYRYGINVSRAGRKEQYIKLISEC